MRIGRAIVALTVLGFFAAAPVAQADEIDIDLTGWQTFGPFNSPLNSFEEVDIGAFSQVTGADWLNLEFTTQNGSFQSEFVLSLNDSSASVWWDSTVSAVDGAGTYSGSGSFPGPADDGGPFTVGADGILYVEVYEIFDDGGASVVDAIVATGTLRVFYTPVPEPASFGLLALGGLMLLRRRGRT